TTKQKRGFERRRTTTASASRSLSEENLDVLHRASRPFVCQNVPLIYAPPSPNVNRSLYLAGQKAEFSDAHSQRYNSHALRTVLFFRHTIKTSRRFVFENIMDLDHVCTVHKRWFRNLRVVAQTPNYVEYRLTSLFYGMRQEIT